MKPFLIDEKISDLYNVISELKQLNNNFNNKEIEREDLYSFYRLLTNINQSRILGKQVSDIKYVYEIIKYNHKRDIRIMSSDEIDDFTISCKVIVIKMNILTIIFYQDAESEFVLDLIYKNAYYTHWHPQDCEEAILDLDTILTSKIFLVFKRRVFRRIKLVDILFNNFDYDRNLYEKYHKNSKYIIRHLNTE